MMEFNGPPRRGLTVPMLATLASAASRACSRGARSGSGRFPGAAPLGFRARTRSRISAITAASSSPFASMFLLVPAGRDLGVHTAPRRELARQRCLRRLAGLYDVAQKPVHHVLLKDSKIPISEHIHLERLQLQTQLVRHVAQLELAMIRQARLGTNRSELRQHDFNLVAWILVRPGLDLPQRRTHAGGRVFIAVLTLHFAGIRILDNKSRNRPTSVTTPTAWPVPRSLTLVATAGLISTHTIFTQLGSMLPTAMECNIDPRHSTSPAPFNCSA